MTPLSGTHYPLVVILWKPSTAITNTTSLFSFIFHTLLHFKSSALAWWFWRNNNLHPSISSLSTALPRSCGTHCHYCHLHWRPPLQLQTQPPCLYIYCIAFCNRIGLDWTIGSWDTTTCFSASVPAFVLCWSCCCWHNGSTGCL